MNRIVVGKSENTLAEFSSSDLFGAPYSVLLIDDVEGVYSVEGFQTLDTALASLRDDERAIVELYNR